MSLVVLHPVSASAAIEERYGAWQARRILARSGYEVIAYDPTVDIRRIAAEIDEDHVVVVTDPLLLAPELDPPRMVELLGSSSVDAVVPQSNVSRNAAQLRAPEPPYLTLRELELFVASVASNPREEQRLEWRDADPGLFVCATSTLRRMQGGATQALEGKSVVVSGSHYVHRWNALRGGSREDLLALVPETARSILDIGCGEGALGASLKARRKCRVVGIEVERGAAAVARRRLDDAYCGDAREIIDILEERFDCIVAGDVVEHLDEPWSFLSALRHIIAPGGTLILSIPNLGHASVVNDLLQGRFDYVYMGLSCVGHLRFFTRQSIVEMLSIAGWTDFDILPQKGVVTAGLAELSQLLERAGAGAGGGDLDSVGFHVIARAPR